MLYNTIRDPQVTERWPLDCGRLVYPQLKGGLGEIMTCASRSLKVNGGTMHRSG